MSSDPAIALHPLVTRIRLPQFFCDLEGAPEALQELEQQGLTIPLS